MKNVIDLKLFSTYKVVHEDEGTFYLMITGQNEGAVEGVISFGKELESLSEDDKVLGSDCIVDRSKCVFIFEKD